jgi:hypothetical protein
VFAAAVVKDCKHRTTTLCQRSLAYGYWNDGNLSWSCLPVGVCTTVPEGFPERANIRLTDEQRGRFLGRRFWLYHHGNTLALESLSNRIGTDVASRHTSIDSPGVGYRMNTMLSLAIFTLGWAYLLINMLRRILKGELKHPGKTTYSQLAMVFWASGLIVMWWIDYIWHVKI